MILKFRLDMSRIVDATVVGAMARFMNHCCQPNAYAKIITVDTELGMDKKIAVFANRDISAGEEITYDYKVRLCYCFANLVLCNDYPLLTVLFHRLLAILVSRGGW